MDKDPYCLFVENDMKGFIQLHIFFVKLYNLYYLVFLLKWFFSSSINNWKYILLTIEYKMLVEM